MAGYGARFNPLTDEAVIANINANRAASAPDKMYTGQGPVAKGVTSLKNYIVNNPAPAPNVPTAADRSEQVANSVMSRLKSFGRGAQPELPKAEPVFDTDITGGIKRWDARQRGNVEQAIHTNTNSPAIFASGAPTTPAATTPAATTPDVGAMANVLKNSPEGLQRDTDALGRAMRQAKMGAGQGFGFGDYSKYTRADDGTLRPIESTTTAPGGAFDIKTQFEKIGGSQPASPFNFLNTMAATNQQIANNKAAAGINLKSEELATDAAYKGGMLKRYAEQTALDREKMERTPTKAEVKQQADESKMDLLKQNQLKIVADARSKAYETAIAAGSTPEDAAVAAENVGLQAEAGLTGKKFVAGTEAQKESGSLWWKKPKVAAKAGTLMDVSVPIPKGATQQRRNPATGKMEYR